MTTYIAVVFQFNHPTKLINLGKYAYYVESNSRANAKAKFIQQEGNNIKPMKNSRYPVQIYTVPEYIRQWEGYHPSYVTEGWQLVSNGKTGYGISTKKARHDKSDVKHAALDDVGTGQCYMHSVPRYK